MRLPVPSRRPGRPILFSVELASGIDDILAFEIVDEADGPRLLSVRASPRRPAGPRGPPRLLRRSRRDASPQLLGRRHRLRGGGPRLRDVVSRREPVPAVALSIAGLLAAGMGLVISRAEPARKVAQHLEMRRHRPNHLGYHREKGELLAFDSLEGILTEMPDAELVGLAYRESAWLVWFIENRYGRESIAGLTAAYRAGRTTDEAILATLSRSSAQLFAEFADWCPEAPKMVTREDIVVYEMGSIPGMDGE